MDSSMNSFQNNQKIKITESIENLIQKDQRWLWLVLLVKWGRIPSLNITKSKIHKVTITKSYNLRVKGFKGIILIICLQITKLIKKTIRCFLNRYWVCRLRLWWELRWAIPLIYLILQINSSNIDICKWPKTSILGISGEI